MKARNVSEAEVLAVEPVPFTESWSPIHHGDIIHQLDTRLQELGLGVVRKDYNMSENGKDLFATWELETTRNDDRARQLLGFRNSMQKHFALGLCAGQSIMVCENMQFSGDFVQHRKHTSGLTAEALVQFLNQAFEITYAQGQLLADFFDYLRVIHIPENNRKVLTYDLMNQGILPPSKFKRFQACYDEERKDIIDVDYDLVDTAQHFHGATTRLLRETSVNSIQDKTGRLNRLMGWGDEEVMADVRAMAH